MNKDKKSKLIADALTQLWGGEISGAINLITSHNLPESLMLLVDRIDIYAYENPEMNLSWKCALTDSEVQSLFNEGRLGPLWTRIVVLPAEDGEEPVEVRSKQFLNDTEIDQAYHIQNFLVKCGADVSYVPPSAYYVNLMTSAQAALKSEHGHLYLSDRDFMIVADHWLKENNLSGMKEEVLEAIENGRV